MSKPSESPPNDSVMQHPFTIGAEIRIPTPNGSEISLILGDINNDGIVDHEDLEILELLVGDSHAGEFLRQKLTPEELMKCDINRDGVVDQADLVILCNHLLAQINMVSMTDELTGLDNRRALKEKAKLKMTSARKFKTNLSCLLADIDDLGQINDNYGTETGDKVLQTVAHTLRANIRSADVIARFGEEKFVILLDQTSQDGASFTAEKLRKCIEALTIDTDKGPLKVTISVGFTSYEESLTFQGMLKQAETALEEAKRNGKNSTFAYCEW